METIGLKVVCSGLSFAFAFGCAAIFAAIGGKTSIYKVAMVSFGVALASVLVGLQLFIWS